MLRENVLRAPEPVGVPAPQVVVDREVVLAFSAYGLVVNVFVRVIAGVGRGIGEASQCDEKLPGIENGAVYEVGFPRFQSSLQLAEKRGKRSEEHTSELQSRGHLVCRLLLEKKKKKKKTKKTN